jgi:hypothetical protein
VKSVQQQFKWKVIQRQSETALTCSKLGGTITNNSTAPSIGGRPKGTTNAASQEFKHRLAMARQQATVDFTLVREKAKSNSTRTPKGSLTTIIADALSRNSIPNEVEIIPHTIRSRSYHANVMINVISGPTSHFLLPIMNESSFHFLLCSLHCLAERPCLCKRKKEVSNKKKAK